MRSIQIIRVDFLSHGHAHQFVEAGSAVFVHFVFVIVLLGEWSTFLLLGSSGLRVSRVLGSRLVQ
jgi:hypothetical protein